MWKSPNEVNLIEYVDGKMVILATQRATPKGRDKLNMIRNDLLMSDSTRLLDIIEHGARL
jgi:hypothetical protein